MHAIGTRTGGNCSLAAGRWRPVSALPAVSWGPRLAVKRPYYSLSGRGSRDAASIQGGGDSGGGRGIEPVGPGAGGPAVHDGIPERGVRRPAARSRREDRR